MRPSANVVAVAPATHSGTLATEGPGDATSLAQPAHPSGAPSSESRADAERSALELPGVTLSGRLAGLEPPHSYDELRVVLWKKGTTPDCEDLASARSHAGPVRVVQATEEGSFVFEGLAADGRYELCAGGARHMSLPMARTVTPGDGPLLLELARVKGLRIELVDSHGAPPQALPLLVKRGLILSGSALTLRGAELVPWEQELAGVPGTGCAARSSPFQRLLVLRGPAEFLSLGPITSYIEIPGYAVESPTFWAHVVNDQLATQRIVLRQLASGWGTLELELVGLGDSIRPHLSDDADLGELMIAYDDGVDFSLPVRGGAELRRFDGLPQGNLRWSYRSPHAFAWPRDRGTLALRIGSEPCRSIVDLSQSGALHVRFDASTTPEPLPFVSTTLANPNGKDLLSLEAARLPWTALVVEPGEYRQAHVAGRDPERDIYFMAPVREGPSTIVEPGRVATLSISAVPPKFPVASR